MTVIDSAKRQAQQLKLEFGVEESTPEILGELQRRIEWTCPDFESKHNITEDVSVISSLTLLKVLHIVDVRKVDVPNLGKWMSGFQH